MIWIIIYNPIPIPKHSSATDHFRSWCHHSSNLGAKELNLALCTLCILLRIACFLCTLFLLTFSTLVSTQIIFLNPNPNQHEYPYCRGCIGKRRYRWFWWSSFLLIAGSQRDCQSSYFLPTSGVKDTFLQFRLGKHWLVVGWVITLITRYVAVI